jgi:guanine deaminase
MTEPVTKYMQLAIEVAMQGMYAGEGGPFGAVVVHDGEVVGRGHNRVTSTNDPTAHAEVVAIRDACRQLGHFQLTACELYTTCEPCPMCLGAIYWARPQRVWYGSTREDAASAGFDDAMIYREIQLPPDQRLIPMQQCLDTETALLFNVWHALPAKKMY